MINNPAAGASGGGGNNDDDGSEDSGAGRPVTTPNGGVPASGTPSLTGTRAPLPFTGSSLVPMAVLAGHLVLAGFAFLLIVDTAKRRKTVRVRTLSPRDAWRVVRSPEVRQGEGTLRCVHAAAVLWSDRWRS